MKITLEIEILPDKLPELRQQLKEAGGIQKLVNDFISEVKEDDFGDYLTKAPVIVIEAPELQDAPFLD